MAFLHQKWARELEYRLIKEVWTYGDNRIAVRFAYESHNVDGQWFRSHGNENWEFDEHGLMRQRHAQYQRHRDRRNRPALPLGQIGPRPSDHANLTELGL